MTKRLRTLSAILVLLLLSALSMGCDFFKKEPKTTPPTQTPSENQNVENTQNTEDKDKVQTGTGTGIYQGQIDNNSVEIEVREGAEKIPTAFQLSGEVKEKFAEYDLKTGDNVSFSYETPEVGQPILTEISK